jgi:hypothetical protein
MAVIALKHMPWQLLLKNMCHGRFCYKTRAMAVIALKHVPWQFLL